jgi:3-hydroxybutyrate dehydrogenase/3-oxoacyl-[acyl-carrier protein] reductase
LFARNPDKGAKVVEELGGPERALFVAGDVMSQSDIEGFIDKTIAHFGTLDILVNNAGGAGDLQPLVNLSDEAFDEAMKWNVYSTFYACRRALPPMLEKGDGRIINMSSMEGKHGKPVFTAYTAAKHAVNGLTKSLAREVGEAGVTVNSICPGLVVTDIIKNNGPETAKAMGMEFDEMIMMFASEAAIKRPNTVEEIAAVALLLASKEGAGITGAMFSVDGGTAQF